MNESEKEREIEKIVRLLRMLDIKNYRTFITWFCTCEIRQKPRCGLIRVGAFVVFEVLLIGLVGAADESDDGFQIVVRRGLQCVNESVDFRA